MDPDSIKNLSLGEKAVEVRTKLLNRLNQAREYYWQSLADSREIAQYRDIIKANLCALEAMDFVIDGEKEPEVPLHIEAYVNRFLNRIKNQK